MLTYYSFLCFCKLCVVYGREMVCLVDALWQDGPFTVVKEHSCGADSPGLDSWPPAPLTSLVTWGNDFIS